MAFYGSSLQRELITCARRGLIRALAFSLNRSSSRMIDKDIRRKAAEAEVLSDWNLFDRSQYSFN
jgi:hypothetical protein